MKSTQKSLAVKRSITETIFPSLQQRLRSQVGKTRMARAEVDAMILLMQEAANRLDYLEARVKAVENPSTKQVSALFLPKE